MTIPSEPTPSVQQQVQGDGNQAIGVNHGTAIRSVEQYVERQTVQAPPRQLSLHQLPIDIADFTGRTKELEKITALLQPGQEVDRPAVVISAVAGMAGVGKSALAIRVAHQLAPDFPDVQLYVNLRGADERSLDPADVLLGWLRAFGIDESQVPAELEQRSLMYRSCLAGKQSLVVLDNARDGAQVQPLLPGSSCQCAVIVTSRRRLATLAGAEILDLEVMEPGEALDLLKKLAGRQVAAELAAAMQLAEQCGRLPLALRIAGSLLRLKPHWTVTDLVGKLEDERRRLEQLQLEDLDVRASFNLSYGELGEPEARLFRFLGLLPRDFGPGVAAAMLEWEKEATLESLERLIDAQLLEAFGVGRFVQHDLMRLLAREHLERQEVEKSAAAEGRVVQWYWERLELRENAFDPVRRRQMARVLHHIGFDGLALPADNILALMAEGTLPSKSASAIEISERTLSEFEQFLPQEALRWFSIEHSNLIDAVRCAYRLKAWDKVVTHACNLVPFFDALGNWNDWIKTHRLALVAARNAEDPEGEAQTLSNLGLAHRELSEWDEAIRCFRESSQIFRDLRDQEGEAQALGNLGVVYRHLGNWNRAVEYLREDLQLCNRSGNLYGEALTLCNLGNVFLQKGLYDDATTAYREGLQKFRDVGDQQGESQALNNLGIIYSDTGKLYEAASCFESCLPVFRALFDQRRETQALANLGIVYSKQGKLDEAASCFEGCLPVFRALLDKRSEATTLLNLGIVYDNQNRLDEAITCYQESQQIKFSLGDRHGEGQILLNLGVLNNKRQQPQQARVFWQEALTKLHPDSPEFQTVSGWLEQLQNSQPKTQNSPWRWLLSLGYLTFIGFNLLAGHWLLALAAAALGLGVWVWRQRIQN
jgi:tetratricopeptide (TPR) repeat protein